MTLDLACITKLCPGKIGACRCVKDMIWLRAGYTEKEGFDSVKVRQKRSTELLLTEGGTH